jgi:hypothetical protein
MFGDVRARFQTVSVRYNFQVARGWESKSVEDQQAQHAESESNFRQRLTPEEMATRRIKDGLMLSRKQITDQMESAKSPQHREMLAMALSHLDAEIARIG